MSLDFSLPLALSRHADLKTRAKRDILVMPERAVRVGGSGGEILRLVIEGGTGHSILTTMANRYPETTSLDSEVRDFLEKMLAIGAIVHPRES